MLTSNVRKDEKEDIDALYSSNSRYRDRFSEAQRAAENIIRVLATIVANSKNNSRFKRDRKRSQSVFPKSANDLVIANYIPIDFVILYSIFVPTIDHLEEPSQIVILGLGVLAHADTCKPSIANKTTTAFKSYTSVFPALSESLNLRY